MPDRIWRITRGASALNGLHIVYVEDPDRSYNLMTTPPHSSFIVRGTGDPPSFNNFTLDGSPWTWSMSVSSMSPNPAGTYRNNNPAPNPAAQDGSWQSEAVPEPLPESLVEGKEGKESAGAASN